MDDELLKKAEAAAARLLKFRQTKRAFREKMRRKGFTPDVVDAVTEKAERLGSINDTDYAMAFAHDSVLINRYGKIKIMKSLLQKGISRDIAESALGMFDDEIYLENLAYFAAKFFDADEEIGTEEKELFKKKMLSRGYTFRQIDSFLECGV